jgi:sugar phosphate isomerase/epimerase
MEKKNEGDQHLVKAVRELADFAAPFGVKIAVYPHLQFYCERLEHSISISKMVDRPNVGAIFNTCHLFKVEGMENWQQKLMDAIPHLFMISINGIDEGDTKNMDWDRLIQPMGEGTFDTYKLVKLAKDNGYEGIFGLQCYNIKQDCETALAKSMKTWETYKLRYAQEK